MNNHKKMPLRYLFTLSMVMLSQVACDRSTDFTESKPALSVSEPDSFALFLNPQYSLSARDYKIVAATANVGESGNYTLTIEQGSETLFSTTGVWGSSGGQDPVASGNTRFTLRLPKIGGLRISLVSETADSYVYLTDSADNVLYEDDNSGGGNNALIDLPENTWNSQLAADAYYQAIDPLDERLTLNAWKSKNGFGSGTGTELTVAFRDTKDLGYGRRMYFRQNEDGSVAVYVENYQFAGVEGLEYGLLNLDALVNNDQRHHFGSNAIEFSPGPGGGEMFAKFYTFKADTNNANADEVRISTVDLDGRGAKAMPGVCIVCHGGDNSVLKADGSFYNSGNSNAKLQVLEVDTFDFAEVAGLTREEQEAAIKQINQMIVATYPSVQTPGQWDSSLALDMAEGWYGGTGMPADSFDGDYVPPGWRHDPDTGNPPAGADELFLNVVKPSCLVCHSKRGSDLYTDINFSSYNKFISYADTIEDYVYESGIMPLALLQYNNFWNSTDPYQPELLASHLSGFSHLDANGDVEKPGKPVARPGPDRRVNGSITLNAEASLFYKTVSWQILSQPSPGSNGVIDNVSALRPTFSADEDGDYIIELTVTNDKGVAASSSQTITLDSAQPVSRDLSFETDIKPIIQGNAAPITSCITCHTDDVAVTTRVEGIPVLYRDDPDLYFHVLERVNLKQIERSRFLRKPTGFHHYGGLQPGYDLSADSTHYNAVLNWISEGAKQ